MANVPRETIGLDLTAAVGRYLPDLPPRVEQFFALHYGLLLKWNSAHNLTRIVEPESAALLHYVDSIVPLLDLARPSKIVDIGSGTGLPGIAAAAWWPESRVVLVESSAKKVSFLRAFRAQLDNPSFEVLQGRCEAIPPLAADLLLIRATFKWPEIPARVARHLAPGGQLLAYLGQAAPTTPEWKKATAQVELVDAEIKKYQLPGANHIRHAATAKKE
jgi:16S rRNA (guanine527-N7)-methyltransferase